MICLRETPRGDQRTTEIPTRDVRARGCARFMRDVGLTGGCSVRVVGLRIGLRHYCGTTVSSLVHDMSRVSPRRVRGPHATIVGTTRACGCAERRPSRLATPRA